MFKCKLTITIDEDNELNVSLENPGKVPPLMLVGAMDLIKFELLHEIGGGIVRVNQEDEDADSSK